MMAKLRVSAVLAVAAVVMLVVGAARQATCEEGMLQDPVTGECLCQDYRLMGPDATRGMYAGMPCGLGRVPDTEEYWSCNGMGVCIKDFEPCACPFDETPDVFPARECITYVCKTAVGMCRPSTRYLTAALIPVAERQRICGRSTIGIPRLIPDTKFERSPPPLCIYEEADGIGSCADATGTSTVSADNFDLEASTSPAQSLLGRIMAVKSCTESGCGVVPDCDGNPCSVEQFDPAAKRCVHVGYLDTGAACPLGSCLAAYQDGTIVSSVCTRNASNDYIFVGPSFGAVDWLKPDHTNNADGYGWSVTLTRVSITAYRLRAVADTIDSVVPGKCTYTTSWNTGAWAQLRSAAPRLISSIYNNRFCTDNPSVCTSNMKSIDRNLRTSMVTRATVRLVGAEDKISKQVSTPTTLRQITEDEDEEVSNLLRNITVLCSASSAAVALRNFRECTQDSDCFINSVSDICIGGRCSFGTTPPPQTVRLVAEFHTVCAAQCITCYGSYAGDMLNAVSKFERAAIGLTLGAAECAQCGACILGATGGSYSFPACSS